MVWLGFLARILAQRLGWHGLQSNGTSMKRMARCCGGRHAQGRGDRHDGGGRGTRCLARRRTVAATVQGRQAAQVSPADEGGRGTRHGGLGWKEVARHGPNRAVPWKEMAGELGTATGTQGDGTVGAHGTEELIRHGRMVSGELQRAPARAARCLGRRRAERRRGGAAMTVEVAPFMENPATRGSSQTPATSEMWSPADEGAPAAKGVGQPWEMRKGRLTGISGKRKEKEEEGYALRSVLL